MKIEEKYICDIETFDEKWEVFMKPNNNMVTSDGKYYNGLTILETHEIHLSSDMDTYRLREVVYHEVTHAFNISMYGNKRDFTDEEMCDFIGRYGYHINKQSQKIIKKLEEAQDV
jgi:hypothetical protein